MLLAALGYACSSGESDLERHKTYGPLVRDSLRRQAQFERSDITTLRASQRPVVFDQYPVVCILLLRNDIAQSERCYHRREMKWVLVKEGVSPTSLSR